jgi:hypothetical protein
MLSASSPGINSAEKVILSIIVGDLMLTGEIRLRKGVSSARACRFADSTGRRRKAAAQNLQPAPLHSALNYQSPVAFGAQFMNN